MLRGPDTMAFGMHGNGPSAARAHAARVYAMQGLLGAAGLAAATFAVVSGVCAVDVGSQAAHRTTLLGLPVAYPAANAAALVVLALAGLGVVVLVRALRAVLREARAQRRFHRGLALTGRRWHGALVLDDARLDAFCAGCVRPRVYLTSGALTRLGGRELRAVLAHERQHARRRDPLRTAAARVLGEALFFLPAARRLGERSSALAELSADEAAVRASAGDPAPLAAALLAFAQAQRPAQAVGIAPERVDHLAGRPPTHRLPLPALALAFALLGALAAVSWLASRSAAAGASLALPLLSRQPCVLALAGLPLALSAVATVLLRRRTRRPS